jgi:hypothetical protein
MTRASFGRNIINREFASALTYRLQKKRHLEYNADNTNYQLLVTWRFDNRYGFIVRVLLIKHDNAIALDEDKLKKLDYSSSTLLKNDRIIKNTWVLDDATVLITSKWKERIRTTEITISKGIKGNDSMVPVQVSSNM